MPKGYILIKIHAREWWHESLYSRHTNYTYSKITNIHNACQLYFSSFMLFLL